MKFIAIIAIVMSGVAATAIPAELQERQCIFNGHIVACDPTNNQCCSGHCEAVPCGSSNEVCQPATTGCT
ncbi:hypothetical protein J3E72DRAFT_231163 [Bipolaris maydis]|nr:hypothetical protein J3E74DRAFT_283338 [Bipolaris maydis]KAJ5054949.1 hypothetical protein J3E74DRAFT_281612 [Bipolaris maydis]KAJ6202826.1 hypothetical protein J3E72DRAFT_231163 [Bipolaris maydis]